MGGTLVTLGDQAEQDFVVANFSVTSGQTNLLWTGYYSPNTDTNFLWTSSEASAYVNWGAGQPDFIGTEGVVHLNTAGDNRWNNLPAAFSSYGGLPLRGVVEVIPTVPVLLSQPVSTTVMALSGAAFGVTAAGAAPLSYVWQRYGTNLNLATGSDLFFPSVTRAFSGPFRVVVMNGYGSVTSAVAVLQVLTPQVLQRPNRSPNGTVQLLFGDTSGGLAPDLTRLEVHSTTNLNGPATVWVTNSVGLTYTNVVTPSATNTLILFTDPAALGAPRRFYRVIER